jgi:hypothetical protein
MRKLNQIDLEAEREGAAISRFRKEYNVKRSQGKRILKQRRGHGTGERIIQTKIEKRHV